MQSKRKYPKNAARLPLDPALLNFPVGRQKGLPAPLPPRGIHAAPLRAAPDKICGVRRGKRGNNTLLRNVGS